MLRSLATQTTKFRTAYVCSSCLGRTLAGREALNIWQARKPTVNPEQVRTRVGHLNRDRQKKIKWDKKVSRRGLAQDLQRNFQHVAKWQRTRTPAVEPNNFRLLKLLTDRLLYHMPPSPSQSNLVPWTTYSLDGSSQICWHNKIDYDRDPQEYCRLYQGFAKTIFERVLEPKKALSDGGHRFKAPNMNAFKDAYISLGLGGIDGMMKAYFRIFKLDNRAQPKIATTLKPESFYNQFRYPIEWYPEARRMERTWHLHIGPTNSGKTYNALKRLEESGNGVYAGPLRLLAHEVYTRFNNRGIPCNLVTGEEMRLISDDCRMSACTVEMTPLHQDMEVCVLDEIQMLADPDRGNGWTNTLLGVRAKEIHLCGEVRTKNIIQRLAKLTKEKLVIHEYKRLGPLQVEPLPIQSWDDLMPGDAVIGFSRAQLFALKNAIEARGRFKCAIVYGNLPAEVRAEQARLFNDPTSGYDIIVASDAIGMGLNLSIRRVVFSMMAKFDGLKVVNLTVPQTLQIAGRAGRYKSAQDDVKKDDAESSTAATTDDKPQDAPLAENTEKEGIQPLGPLPGSRTVGYVTSHVDGNCHRFLGRSMGRAAESIDKAVIQPSTNAVINFAAICPDNIPFSSVLMCLLKMTQGSQHFEFSDSRDILEAAEILDEVEGLDMTERYTLALAPVKTRSVRFVAAYLGFARAVEARQLISIEDVPDVDLEALDDAADGSVSIGDQLKRLEELHQVFILYMWLYYRFQHVFGSPQTVVDLKESCEQMIQQLLTEKRKFASLEQQQKLQSRKDDLFGDANNPLRSTTLPMGDMHQRSILSAAAALRRKEAENSADLLHIRYPDGRVAERGLDNEFEERDMKELSGEFDELARAVDEEMKETRDASRGAGFRFNPEIFQKRNAYQLKKPELGRPKSSRTPHLRPLARSVGRPSRDEVLEVYDPDIKEPEKPTFRRFTMPFNRNQINFSNEVPTSEPEKLKDA